jgi:hypothetical protein
VNSFTQPNRNGAEGPCAWSSDDELGQLIRWSLRSSVGAAEPSPDVWCRILERVKKQRQPTSAPPSSSRSSPPLGGLLQAAVIGCLLLTLAAGIDGHIIVTRRDQPVRVAAAVKQSLASDDLEQDVLKRSAARLMEREEPVRRGGEIRDATLSS